MQVNEMREEVRGSQPGIHQTHLLTLSSQCTYPRVPPLKVCHNLIGMMMKIIIQNLIHLMLTFKIKCFFFFFKQIVNKNVSTQFI